MFPQVTSPIESITSSFTSGGSINQFSLNVPGVGAGVVTGNTQPPPSSGGGIVNSNNLKPYTNTTNIPTGGTVSNNVKQEASNAQATGVTLGKSSSSSYFLPVVILLVFGFIFRKKLGFRF